MHDSSEPEVEPPYTMVELYEEVTGDLNWSTPVGTRVLGPVIVTQAMAARPSFYEPMIDRRRRSVEGTQSFAHVPRPILRHPDELAEMNEEPRFGVAATERPLYLPI